VRETIFLAISRHTELEIGVAYFGGTTGGATVKRFFFTARLNLETMAPNGHLLALPEMADYSRAKENEIVAKGYDERQSVGIRLRREAEEKEACVSPSDPFYLQRQDEKEINDLLRIKMGEGEEEGGEKHLAGELTVGDNSGERCSDHSNEKIEREAERAPGALKTVADEPQKPQRDGDHQRISHPRNEDVGDEPPDLTRANPADIEGQIGIEALVDKDKNEDKCIQGHDGADQSGDRNETKASFESVQKAHRCFTVAGRSSSSSEASARRRTLIDTHEPVSRMSLMSDAAQKKTPLYDEHVRLGAKMIPFGDWIMPVQYSGILDEHQAVRNNVGVFDISHMGQLVIAGSAAGAWLNEMLTNNTQKLEVGTGQYTFLLNERGGIIDDLIVYRTAVEEFLLVVNASRTDEDFSWLSRHRPNGGSLSNRSAEYGGLAIQGPRVVDLFHVILGDDVDLPPRNAIVHLVQNGMQFLIARTGYTGEDGVEVFFPAKDAARVWNEVLNHGRAFGIRPCGLGARDTLRLEMCYPLNGSDLSPEHNPIEAGLGFFVDLKKTKFIGREDLVKAKERGTTSRLVPFRMKSKGPPPRPHYSVWRDGEQIGEVTSGTLSPSLNEGIGMAYIAAPHARVDTEIEIEIRGQRFPAMIEKKPLYKKS
jgi:glycine cleavage system T protein (aminomethyltransferase)